MYARKRVYALCTAIPFAFAIVTVFAAGAQSILMWWNKPETNATDIFLMKLACVLASIMLGLSAIIAVDAVRRWYTLLNGAAKQPAVAPAVSASES
jgi:carbon starvation protein CstA